MQEIYPVLDEAEMIVLASPVYYHGFTGQLQCAVNRIYAYQNSFLDYLKFRCNAVAPGATLTPASRVRWGKPSGHYR